MAAIDGESWAECMAGELQHLATALLDHGDAYSNAERTLFQNHANYLRNIERGFQERKTITNHKGSVVG